MKKSRNTLKPLTLLVGALLLIGAGYTVYAYANKTWPFDNGSTAGQNGVNSKTPESSTNEKEPLGYNLTFESKIETKKQGTCTLEMKNKAGETVLTDKNSTVGKEGKVGCDEWKLNTSDLPSGDYDVTVEFNAEGEKAVSKTTISI